MSETVNRTSRVRKSNSGLAAPSSDPALSLRSTRCRTRRLASPVASLETPVRNKPCLCNKRLPLSTARGHPPVPRYQRRVKPARRRNRILEKRVHSKLCERVLGLQNLEVDPDDVAGTVTEPESRIDAITEGRERFHKLWKTSWACTQVENRQNGRSGSKTR